MIIGNAIGIPFGVPFGRGRGFTPIPEYKAVLAAMATEPSKQDQINQNTWLKAMVDGGYFAKAELLDMLSADIENNSLINWKSPGIFNPAKVGTPLFQPYRGFRSYANSAIKLNFIPGTNASIMSQNSTCVMIGIGTDKQDYEDDFGAYTGAEVGRLSIRARLTNNIGYFRCNSSGLRDLANTNSIKWYTISRGASGTFMTYLNKTGTSANAASNGLTEHELYAGGINQNGTIKYTEKHIRFVFIFSHLSENEIFNVIDITEAYLKNYHTNLIDYDEYIVKPYTNTKAVVPLTTYDGSGQTLHPSVVSIPAGWNGYKYWLADTPFTDAAGENIENPSIWASNNGADWVVPDGLTNPVIAKPSDGYNADPHLFHNIADNKLYMLWKEETGAGRLIKMCSSADGVNWDTPVTILTPISGETACISPALIKVGNIYYIYYFTYDTTPTNNPRVRRVSCSTINGTYGDREEVNMPHAEYDDSPPWTEQIWWHLDVQYIAGIYWLSAVHSTGAQGKNIFVMRSYDGINFDKSPYPTIYRQDNYLASELFGYYRPCLAIIEGQPTLYYGRRASNSTWGVTKIDVDLFES